MNLVTPAIFIWQLILSQAGSECPILLFKSTWPQIFCSVSKAIIINSLNNVKKIKKLQWPVASNPPNLESKSGATSPQF